MKTRWFKGLLPALALLAPTAAHAEWQKASSEHFIVYSDDSPDSVREFTTKLERFDKAVRTLLGLPDRVVGPNARVVVYVMATQSDVQKAMGASVRGVAGFYRDYYPSGPVAFVPRNSSSDSELTPQVILRHEYAHHLMYSSWGNVVFPPWFSEGFAELFATAQLRDDGSVVIGANPVYRSYGIDRAMQFPVERLVREGPDYRDAMDAQVFYGRSWLLVDYYIFDKERSKLLADYIRAVNQGKSPAEAAKVLGITSSLDLKLNSYLRRSQLPSATLTADQLKIAPVTVRALTPGEAAAMPALLESQAGVDEKEAPRVVEMARRAAAAFPGDAGAQNELAEAEYDAGNFELADAAAARALAADPESMHATIYRGMAQVALAKKAKTKDPAVWNAARRWFLAANKLDPLYSWPIQLLYESYLTEGRPPSKGASDGLLYAYQLFPSNPSLRLLAIDVLLARGETKAAHVALEPIAYSPHGGAMSKVAKDALAALDASGAPAAIAVIDAARKKAEGAGKGGEDGASS